MLALSPLLKPHASCHHWSEHWRHSLQFFGYIRCRKYIHVEHLFSEFANLLAHDLLHRALLRMSNPAHFGGKEEFFEVGEREAVGQFADLCCPLSRETQAGLERFVPHPHIGTALWQLRQIEWILAVEAARTVENGGIEPIRMIGRGEGHDADVRGETVQLVQEKRAILGREQRIEVFEDQYARRGSAGAVEDLADVEFVGTLGVGSAEALHIEAGLLQRVDEGFDGVGLAVSSGSDEQDTAFPGHVVLFIQSPRSKELDQVIEDLLLEAPTQDQVRKRGVLDILEEILVLVPAAIVEHQHLATNLRVPATDGGQETASDRFGLGEKPEMGFHKSFTLDV